MRLLNTKDPDTRPRRHGWAPGAYYCKCGRCKDQFIGDKRAITCADCAYAMPDEPPVPLYDPVADMIDAYNTVWNAERHIDGGNVERVRRNAMTAAFWAVFFKRP